MSQILHGPYIKKVPIVYLKVNFTWGHPVSLFAPLATLSLAENSPTGIPGPPTAPIFDSPGLSTFHLRSLKERGTGGV